MLVDDQPLVRAGLRRILETQSDIEVVGEAGDGEAALRSLARTQPDVVLMDIRMPGLDGIETTRRLRGARVLILTTFELDEYILDALRAGASGFLLKDAEPEELVRAVRIVAAGDALLAPSVTRRLLEQVAGQLPAGDHVPPKGFEQLTAREREVLRLVARWLSNAEIANQLVVSETTVKNHVSHLLAKRDLRDRVQAFVLAHHLNLAADPH